MIAIVKLRTEYKGRPIRPECEPLNGRTLEFRRGWLMNDDDPYPGEIAWIPTNQDELTGICGAAVVITWLASGDLKIIDEDDDFKTDGDNNGRS